ncbi:MAG: acyl-CoA/acyl-ACP dehydrogenase [Deltaproteobacteria bacterium]|nr:acyl-CoA/acyl-ACP dehydrogenase [Deltaproteobacteria bacterium]
MSSAALKLEPVVSVTDWVAIVRTLGKDFEDRAVGHDQHREFVAANYADLREKRLFSAGIPTELGGGGASHEELCEVVRELGRHCGSTALAFAMHTHPVATNVYKHLRGDEAASNALRRIAAKELVIAGTGANDWLGSSGQVEPVEGGYRVNAHKRFVSGSAGADLFVTSANHEGAEGSEVLHFAVPFDHEGVHLVETWDALGMRGTGSHDVILEDVFLPEDSIVLRRPSGDWHPMWNVVIPTAMPLITAAYVGLAEAAVELAKTAAMRRGVELAPVVGEMTTALTVAQLAFDDMVRMNDNHGFTPTLEAANAILTRKAIVADAVKDTVELASELVGGPGFLRGHHMERIVRDVRAMHFHPLPVRRQRIFSGRIALGHEPIAS